MLNATLKFIFVNKSIELNKLLYFYAEKIFYRKVYFIYDVDLFSNMIYLKCNL